MAFIAAYEKKRGTSCRCEPARRRVNQRLRGSGSNASAARARGARMNAHAHHAIPAATRTARKPQYMMLLPARATLGEGEGENALFMLRCLFCVTR